MGSSHRRDAGTIFYYSATNCIRKGWSYIKVFRRVSLPVATSITLLVRPSKRFMSKKKELQPGKLLSS